MLRFDYLNPEEHSHYTMTLEELMKQDPDVFNFEYSPQIIINGVDLKDLVAARFKYREIGQETPEQFKNYLRLAFLTQAERIFNEQQQYLKLLTKDNFINYEVNSKNVLKFYATPAEGYNLDEELESTKNTDELNQTSSSEYPILVYRAYIDNLNNFTEDTLNRFNYLFMALLD